MYVLMYVLMITIQNSIYALLNRTNNQSNQVLAVVSPERCIDSIDGNGALVCKYDPVSGAVCLHMHEVRLEPAGRVCQPV